MMTESISKKDQWLDTLSKKTIILLSDFGLKKNREMVWLWDVNIL